MASGRVLVIHGDEPSGSALARALEAKGFAVMACTEARVGFRIACEAPVPWDCIVCTPELPDIDGVWVARRIRTEAGPIAKVPILFHGELVEKSVRSQALSVGVDVFLARPPATEDDVIAQVQALVAMARRLDSDENGPPSMSISAAIRGDLSAFPLASLLMMFEMERRSGTVQVVAQSGKRCVLTISAGLFASTESGGVQRPPLDVLREVLSWRSGRFSFHPRETGTLPAPRASVGALVLEAMRLEDEEKGPIPELNPDDVFVEETKNTTANGGAAPRTGAHGLPILHEEKVQIREDTEHKKVPPPPPPPPPRPKAKVPRSPSRP